MTKSFGLAAVLALVAVPVAAQRRPAPAHPAPYWEAALGVSGGFVDTYAPGLGGTVTSFTMPLIGSNGALALQGLATPPALFGVIPVSERWAIEPAFDYHSLHIENGIRLSTVLLSARADYALGRVWYAAAGGQLSYLDANGASGETRTGALVGVGARFHLVGGIGGRFEMNYGFFGKSTSLPSQQSVSWMFGATMPLK